MNLEQHKLVFDREGQLCGIANKRHYFELLQMSSEVEDGQGISILTLPKGLSLNKIIAFAPAPMTGNATQVHVLWQEIIEKQGDVELGETVTVAITNGVFKDSRKKEVAKQIELVKGLKCEMPQVVVVAALAILRFRSSDPYNPLRLFGIAPWTSTRCVEIVGGLHFNFGCFGSGGASVSVSRYDEHLYGVGGQRKFEAIGP